MYTAIHLPDFHLQAVLRKEPGSLQSSNPIALLDERAGQGTAKDRNKARIIQLNPAARRAGVEAGMTATQGLARCAELDLRNRSLADEKIAQHLLLACGAAFSPDIEDTAPGVCTIDLLGSRSLQGGLEKLGAEVRRSLAISRLEVRVGIAENPDLALLAARLTRGTKIIRATRGEVGAFLAPLPIEAVEPSEELLSVLGLWGIHTVGDLLALPAQEVVERLGPEAGRIREQTSGGRRRLLRLVRPSADYSRELEFEHHVEQLDPLLFVIRRMLETIAARLAAAYLVAEEITLSLKLDDASVHRRRFRVPEPSGDVDLLFRMLHTYLDGVTTESPVTALRIEAVPARPSKHQYRLFESSLRDPNRFSETLARLEALLGSERVGTPAALPTHRSDAFAMRVFQERTEDEEPRRKRASSAGRTPDRDAGETSGKLAVGLPLRRFRPALSVNVLTQYDPKHAVEHPCEILSGAVHGRLRRRRGPWLGSGEWWDRETWARHEWDVELENGNLYRLVHEQEGWALEGIYG